LNDLIDELFLSFHEKTVIEMDVDETKSAQFILNTNVNIVQLILDVDALKSASISYPMSVFINGVFNQIKIMMGNINDKITYNINSY